MQPSLPARVRATLLVPLFPLLAACAGCAGDGGLEAGSTGLAPGGDAALDGGGVEAGFDGSHTAGEGGLTQGEGGSGSTDSCRPVLLSETPACTRQAPPASFELREEWSWNGLEGYRESIVIPLVINLTDDNGDGAVDLCDTPDVVVTVSDTDLLRGYLVFLDGASGRVHAQSEVAVDPTHTPAVADLDGDGRPEVLSFDSERRLIAVDASGALQFTGDSLDQDTRYVALAVGNLDGEGAPEVVAGNHVFDAEGHLLRVLPDIADTRAYPSAPVLSDLDGDGDLEVVLGRSAYHHDGTLLYELKDVLPMGGVPLVADLDLDGAPEVWLANETGLARIEADGTLSFQGARPLAAWSGPAQWKRPACVADVDADARPELLLSAGAEFAILTPDLDVLWSHPIEDESGAASGTAFDFLGDGSAEAIYADERSLFVFGEGGDLVLQAPRSSRTLHEYPVVADVDNDGSAEILVVSNTGFDGEKTAPTLQVFGDAEDRWIQARRIWNQHTYHVTNIEEDGRVPLREEPHWMGQNTFRANSAIEGSHVCTPVLL